MSHIARRALIAVSVAALLGSAPGAAVAKTSPSPKKPASCKAAKKKGKRPTAKACAKPKPKPVPGTPVGVTLLEGSHAVVDVPAVPLPGGYVLPGTPAVVTVPISGQLKGDIPGGYQLGKDNKINLTSAAISIAPVDILGDPGCGGASVLRINPASNVVLDKLKPSVGTVFASGKVTANVRVALNLAFDSRQGTTCDAPLVTMGNSTSSLPVDVGGMVAKETGLAALKLDGAPTPLTVGVCLTPGAPSAPCGTPPAGYPVNIAVHVVTKIAVG